MRANLQLGVHELVDTVARLHPARKVDPSAGRALGPGDRLITWTKPQRLDGWSKQAWEALPDTLDIRLVRIIVQAPGFRTRTVTLATTPIDPVAYPSQELRALYGQRWNVELHFAQLKPS